MAQEIAPWGSRTPANTHRTNVLVDGYQKGHKRMVTWIGAGKLMADMQEKPIAAIGRISGMRSVVNEESRSLYKPIKLVQSHALTTVLSELRSKKRRNG